MICVDACQKAIYIKPLNLAKNCLTLERFFDVMNVDRMHICIARGEELARETQDVPNYDEMEPEIILKLEESVGGETRDSRM